MFSVIGSLLDSDRCPTDAMEESQQDRGEKQWCSVAYFYILFILCQSPNKKSWNSSLENKHLMLYDGENC